MISVPPRLCNGAVWKREVYSVANLMLTKQCNLHCPYCFANEFVNKDSELMSFDSFRKALQFLSTNPDEKIGLIGGEPTLHPEFKKMLAYLIDSPFRFVSIFTNGIKLEPYFNELRDSKFHILINVNEPEKVGTERYNNIVRQIDIMVNQLYMKKQVSIGINLYKEDMDYGFFLKLIERYRFNQVRVSVSVPNLDDARNVNPLAYFKRMMPTVRRFVRDIVERGAAPSFDCNYIPPCLLEEQDIRFYKENETVMRRSSFRREGNICHPVLDILPSLEAIRCFAMSDYHKASILEFRNVDELRRHFELEIDGQAYGLPPCDECRDCHEYLVGKCSCGCYAYRLASLKALRDIKRQSTEMLYKKER